MSSHIRRIAVCTGGGDAPGLNAVIRAVAIAAANRGWECYGIHEGFNGILFPERYPDGGVFRLTREKVRGIGHLGGTILGTTNKGNPLHFPMKMPDGTTKDMDLSGDILEFFARKEIDALVSIGGDGSLTIANALHQKGLRVVGVPKTIDNDLPVTDHCPGYGSVIKYNSATVMEIGFDVGSMATDDGSCCIVEVMGRAAGWIAAGTVLAKQGNPANPPHIIILPEIPLNEAAFLNRVKEVVAEHKYCVVVCGEGVKNEAGEEIGADKTRLDAFGHAVLSGAADALASIVQGKLNLKTRTVKLGYAQRAAAHYASLTDADEAFACGTAAVRAAVSGKSGLMPKIVRLSSSPYRWEIQLEPLENIANVEHFIPRDWISEDGFLPNEKFVEYAAPLIEGQVVVPQKNGLPSYTILAKSPVEKKLAPRA